MNVEEFMKKNNIAILVEVDLKNKKMDIKKTDIELESPDLFKQLIEYGNVESLIECVEGRLLPRIWAQGNTKCIISKASEEKIIAKSSMYGSHFFSGFIGSLKLRDGQQMEFKEPPLCCLPNLTFS